MGIGESLYNGTLGAHSNSSKKIESDITPVPSFGRISGRDDRSSNKSQNESFSLSKGLTFSE